MATMPAEPAANASTAQSAKGTPGWSSLQEQVGTQVACLPRLAFAAIVYSIIWRVQPVNYSLAWAMPIIAHNVGLCWFVGLAWDGALLGMFRSKMAPHKYNPSYAAVWRRNGTAPIARDVFWSTCTALIAAMFEIIVRIAVDRGRIVLATVQGDEWWYDGPTLLWCLSWFYWFVTVATSQRV